MTRLAIFASGNGSNFQRIAEYFKENAEVSVSLLLCNRGDAYVLDRAKDMGIPALSFYRTDFYESTRVLEILRAYSIDALVLAGFLWLLPDFLIAAYPRRILNIHPALLPHYGGKGMYGMHVHRAVIADKATQSGITIHEVDARYDEGEVFFQASCPVLPKDTPERLAEKIHLLEQKHFPAVIEKWVQGF